MASSSSKALATLYRPQTLDEIVEQEAVVKILKNQIKNKTFRNTALFCGPAGTGKTTCARAFAKEINKGKGNPIEIDAASNNGVENIRDITAKAQQKALDCEYKVFIIDECFKGDTLITTDRGVSFIKDIKVGDYIQNLIGYGKVTQVFKTNVLTNRICCVKINGVDTITTVDHLYFTEHGWVCAKDLRRGDLVYANVHMQKLWERVLQTENKSYVHLLQQLLSISDASTTTEGEVRKEQDNEGVRGMRQGVSCKSSCSKQDMFSRMQTCDFIPEVQRLSENATREGSCKNVFNTYEAKQPYVPTGNSAEDGGNQNSQWNTSCMAWGEGWKRELYEAANKVVRGIKYDSCIRVCDTNEDEEGKRLSVLLQSRPCLSTNKTCDRGGWQMPLLESWFIGGCQENQTLEQFRVDGVTVYERGNNDEYFERYFSREMLDSGKLEFYDLAVDTHPSYFANGILVHNCHAMTNAAWQAFLKTLEEPPANTLFLMCTTDPQKLPKTILSRVQRFEFKRISFDGIVSRLKWIVAQEDYNWAKQNMSPEELDKYDAMGAEFKYTYDENALQLISKMAEGGLRDAITMLDKVMSLNDKITVESVVRSLGSADYKVFFALTNSIIDCKEDNVIDIIESIYNDGADLKQFIKQYLMFLLDVNKYAIFKNFKYVQIPDIYEKEIKAVVEGVDLKFLKYLLDQINTLNNDIRWEAQVKPIVEMKLLVLSRDDA